MLENKTLYFGTPIRAELITFTVLMMMMMTKYNVINLGFLFYIPLNIWISFEMEFSFFPIKN